MEFDHRLGELLACRHFLVPIFQIPLDSLKHLERPKTIAVPHVPLDPLHLVVQLRQVVIGSDRDQILDLLPQHRDAHRTVVLWTELFW